MNRRKIKKIEGWAIGFIIIFLVSLLLAVFIKAREGTKIVLCILNLKQIGLISHMYARDYEDYLPPAYCQFSDKYWVEILKPYIERDKLYL